ncbi:MFS transporter, partial [Salmonella enterica]|uniref:MFS transporter n=1 Tax=Salmonella enterica TaxID=28901 RepID=UPI000A6A74CB
FQQHVDQLEQGDREGLQAGPKVTIKEIATADWRSLLSCNGLVIATNVTYYMLFTYMPSCTSHTLHYSEDHCVLIILALMIGMLFLPAWMRLPMRRVRRRPLVILGLHAPFRLAVPRFRLLPLNLFGLGFTGLSVGAGVLARCYPA